MCPFDQTELVAATWVWSEAVQCEHTIQPLLLTLAVLTLVVVLGMHSRGS
jgi:hypothetical protein